MLCARIALTAVMLAAVAAAGCDDPAPGKSAGTSADKSGEPAGDPSDKHGPSGGTDPSAGARDGQASAPGVAFDRETLCASRCLLLTAHKFRDLDAGLYRKLCNTAEAFDERSNCARYDFMRNCIYAAHGYSFKKQKWQKQFGETSWYKPRDEFKDDELTAVEIDNIRALKQLASRCRGGKPGKVTRRDRKFVRAWFKDKQRGKPRLPAKLFVDGAPASDKEFVEFLTGPEMFILKDYTPILLVERESPGGEAFPGKQTRTIVVRTGDAPPDCVENTGFDCGGFEIIEMTFDRKGKLLALHVTASACPFVYAASGDRALALEGEILRNVVSPALERSQGLALSSLANVAPCASPIRVRVAEHKRETSFIDEVYLDASGVRIDARSCRDGRGAHCRDDGRYHRLDQGDVLDLVFELPDRASCAGLVVRADGYYVRLPR